MASESRYSVQNNSHKERAYNEPMEWKYRTNEKNNQTKFFTKEVIIEGEKILNSWTKKIKFSVQEL